MSFDLPFVLPDGWEIKTVEQLIKDKIIEKPLDGNHGGIHPKSSDYVSKGIPFVMASDLHSGRVDLSGCKFITEKQAKTLRKGFAKTGDVLISHKATIGRTAIVQQNDYPYIMLTPQVTYYRIIDDEKLSNVYLKSYFDSPFFQSLLALWAGSGSTRAYLGITGQLKLPVIVPPIDSQKFISNNVFTFNEKIELNTQTNQTLEQIAQAIFKSWFVDFDPVKAKSEALAAGGSADDAELAAMSAISAKTVDELNSLKASNPKAFNKLAQTAALFPAAMQDSEFGEIPEGWEISEIGNEVIVVGGGTPSTKNTEFWEDGTIHWTTPKDMSGLNCKVLTNTDRKITEAGLKKISSGLLSKNTVLMSSRAPVGYLALAKIPVAINQGYIAMKCEGRLSPEYVLLWCEHNMEEIKQRASGTTFAEISKANFKPIPVIVPTKSIIDTFTVQASDIYNIVHANVLQSETLSISRDLLLPQLLSGELSDVFKDGE
ncbi:restriction endonuclease subunit S [Vibrio navarrensis]|uniref:restriction endonuclease subunit S n=1 Tax=Vibrio navarrensis TaxID=29495 RepID=UPI001867C8E9|nr:restriction endonuclease subunit S [Vibrio navarrensis]MBE3664064.1 restriction endonuclease subunit S [Vibrio navarrensis]